MPFRVEMDRQKKEMREKKKFEVCYKKNSLDIFLVGLALLRELWQAKNGNNVKGGRQKTKNVK